MITTMPSTLYFWNAPCGHGAGPYTVREQAEREEATHQCVVACPPGCDHKKNVGCSLSCYSEDA